MAISKSAASVLSAVTTTQTSAAVDCSADYAQQLYAECVVVGTPSAGASIQVQVSPDGGTTYYSPGVLSYTFPTAAGTYDVLIDLPVTATKIKLAYTAQTGGTSSTLTAQLGQVTGV